MGGGRVSRFPSQSWPVDRRFNVDTLPPYRQYHDPTRTPGPSSTHLRHSSLDAPSYPQPSQRPPALVPPSIRPPQPSSPYYADYFSAPSNTRPEPGYAPAFSANSRAHPLPSQGGDCERQVAPATAYGRYGTPPMTQPNPKDSGPSHSVSRAPDRSDLMKLPERKHSLASSFMSGTTATSASYWGSSMETLHVQESRVKKETISHVSHADGARRRGRKQDSMETSHYQVHADRQRDRGRLFQSR